MTQLSDLADKIHDGSARAADLDGVADREVQAIKSDNGTVNYRALFRGGICLKNAQGEESGVVMHDASTEDRDSMGDVISVGGHKEFGGEGWMLAEFRANPQLLWAHQSGSAGAAGESRAKPIGIVADARRGLSKTGEGPALVTKSIFHDKAIFGADSWGDHVEAVKNLVMAGAMPGASVGFLVREIKFFDNEEERSMHNVGRHGGLILESELRELSIVPIPANPNALKRELRDAALEKREAVLSGMAQKGWSGRKEFDELFPFSVEDLREVERRCRRRSVQVGGQVEEFSRITDGNPSPDGILAAAFAEMTAELRQSRAMNEQLSMVLDDLRETISARRTRTVPSVTTPPPIQPDPCIELVAGLTRAAAAANSNGANR